MANQIDFKIFFIVCYTLCHCISGTLLADLVCSFMPQICLWSWSCVFILVLISVQINTNTFLVILLSYVKRLQPSSQMPIHIQTKCQTTVIKACLQVILKLFSKPIQYIILIHSTPNAIKL